MSRDLTRLWIMMYVVWIGTWRESHVLPWSLDDSSLPSQRRQWFQSSVHTTGPKRFIHEKRTRDFNCLWMGQTLPYEGVECGVCQIRGVVVQSRSSPTRQGFLVWRGEKRVTISTGCRFLWIPRRTIRISAGWFQYIICNRFLWIKEKSDDFWVFFQSRSS